jgi:8-amino-7-oxononanoate synthase
MKKLPSVLADKLDERKKSNSFRSLIDADHLIDLYSNDYLGIAKWKSDSSHKQGSTGSRLISGNSKRTEEIEFQLANFFEMDTALFYNSGYDANLGFFSSVPQKGDTVIYDELIHASIRDGLRLANASSFSFKHNDLESLEEKIQRAKGNVYVVVEAIYSMDGDAAQLNDIANICKQYEAYLIVDEAHSGGIFGDEGVGLVSALGLNENVFAKIMTFGKAYGSHGAVVLGQSDLRNYLINFSRSLIYTTALPPHSQERIFEVVQKGAGMDAERSQLIENIIRFKELMRDSNYQLIPSDSAIQSLVVPGIEEAKKLAEKILLSGFAVKAILSPTVPDGSERLRFCLHSYNTEEELVNLSKLING